MGVRTVVSFSGNAVRDGDEVVFLRAGTADCEDAASYRFQRGGQVSGGKVEVELNQPMEHKLCIARAALNPNPTSDSDFDYVAGVTLHVSWDAPPPSPPPPLDPSPVAVEIRFALVIAGSLNDFDADAFRESLANALDGIDEEDIAIEVAAASVRVDVVISPPSTSVADTALDDLTALTSASASSNSLATLSAALGVTVEEVATPPSLVSVGEDASGGESLPIEATVAVAGGSMILVGLVVLRLRRHRKREKELDQKAKARIRAMAAQHGVELPTSLQAL